MSTFDGVIREFPDIRVDFFRGFNHRPPLACFLSHVHSDHLAGLETLRSPFVYCSAATREILLRLEKYPCRLNYAKGIFEDPHMQTYKHLAKVLKPIPLDTPTEVELEPGKKIQVTLLDANHCAGAVMFLIEGNGKAILYTGDIRSEPWWVNSIARNPIMIEYSTGLKTLDRVYLDTSMLDNFPLQTKAEGLRELLKKLSRYPKDTLFHLQAWTYGYEEVWVALSKALNSKIHVDRYKMGVYKSLATRASDSRFAAQTHLTKEAPYLVGFTCGNSQREGCLTLDENVRIHSCEKGMGCKVIETKPVVWIQPIVAHLRHGRDMVEVGIGGGGDDLAQKPSLKAGDILALIEIIDRNSQALGDMAPEIKVFLEKALVVSRDVDLDIEMSNFTEEGSVAEIIKSLAKKVNAIRNPVKHPENGDRQGTLSNEITFPYARHSSLPELRLLIEAFKPKDVWPCTVDPASWAEKGITMKRLFGDLCTGEVFEHDLLMNPSLELRQGLPGGSEEGGQAPETQSTTASQFHVAPTSSPYEPDDRKSAETLLQRPHSQITREQGESTFSHPPQQNKRNYDSFREGQDTYTDDEDMLGLRDSEASTISDYAYNIRLRAFRAAQANVEDNGTWNTIGLISTTDNHSTVEPELGEPRSYT